MYKDRIELLKELSLAFGPSGCTGNVSAKICEIAESYCHLYATDRMGNFVFKISPRVHSAHTKKIMISAHMDEVGMMISEIDGDGYLKFDTVGGIDARVLCGRNVTIGDENRKVKGVIASKAIHHQSADERQKATKVSDMYIDIGATSREDAEKEQGEDIGTLDNSKALESFSDAMNKGILDDATPRQLKITYYRYLLANNILGGTTVQHDMLIKAIYEETCGNYADYSEFDTELNKVVNTVVCY